MFAIVSSSGVRKKLETVDTASASVTSLHITLPATDDPAIILTEVFVYMYTQSMSED